MSMLQTIFAADGDTSTFRDPAEWLLAGLGAARSSAGVRVGPHAALSLSTYTACQRVIAEDVAKLPLIVYRRLPRGKERAQDHPCYRLLHDAPNDEMSAMAFRESLTHHALGWGGGFAEIERTAGGQPVALWPYHPSRVECKRANGEIVYDIFTDDGKRFRLPSDRMFHLHGLGGDGLTGYSIARLAADSLGVAMATQAFGGKFFANGANVSGVYEHPGTLSDKALAHLRESLQSTHAGVENAMKVMITEEGMKFNKITIPPNDAQFLECVVPGTPVAMADGSRKPAEALLPGDVVVGWDNGLIKARVAAVGSPPVKPIVRVTTSRGRTLTASGDHPCLARHSLRTAGGRVDNRPDEWIAAGKLSIGDYVRVGLGHTADTTGGNFSEAWFLGAMAGDGYVRRSACSFSATNSGVIARMAEYLQSVGGSLSAIENTSDHAILTGGRGRRGSEVRTLLNRSGMVGCHAHTKRVPALVMNGGPNMWRGFLSGYLDTDGSVAPSRGKNRQPLVYWSSVNRDLLVDCQHLLACLGINSAIYLMSEGGARAVCGQVCRTRDSWGLYVTGCECLRRLNEILDSAHDVKHERLRAFASLPASRYRDENWKYDRVVSVESLGPGQTVGIEIEGCHTHITGGIVTHNTRQFQVEEICRWHRVNPHKVQHLLRATFSNIEHLALEHVSDTLMPWEVRWEQEIQRKLIRDPQYFAEHLNDALLRGDTQSRYQAHQSSITAGWKTRNEVREAENLNPLDGLDEPLEPVAIAKAPDAKPKEEDKPAPPDDEKPNPRKKPADEDDDSAKVELRRKSFARIFAAESQRILNKQQNAAARAEKKHGLHSSGLVQWRAEFAADMVNEVADSLTGAAEAFMELESGAPLTKDQAFRVASIVHDFARQHCEQTRDVPSSCVTWKTSRAPEMAAAIIGRLTA